MVSADVDDDGLPDVLTGGWWYRNPGSPDGVWTRQEFGGGAANLAAALDVNGDGAVDMDDFVIIKKDFSRAADAE